MVGHGQFLDRGPGNARPRQRYRLPPTRVERGELPSLQDSAAPADDQNAHTNTPEDTAMSQDRPFTLQPAARRPGRRALAVVAAATLLLAACGGEDPLTSSDYASWTNNANGEILKDANNEDFKVRLDNRALVHWASNTRLNGMTIDTNGNIFDGGVAVGLVANATSASGSNIGVLRCLNRRDMNVIVSGSSYSYTC
jgi:hypothetical protein